MTNYDGPALIIEIDNHSPYYLRPGGVLTVGRSSKNDIVIHDPTVSREHAVFRWEGKYPLIQDRNSTSGIVIDNDYANFRHLHGLHQIRIGTTYIQVDFVRSEMECPTQLDNLNLAAKNAVLTELDDSNIVTLFGEIGSEDIVGYLTDNKSLRKLLVHLEMSRRTGTLTITESGLSGTIVFALGKIKGAVCGNRSGEQALQHICCFSHSSYHFTTQVAVGECYLTISPTAYMYDFTKRLTRRRPRLEKEDPPLINSHDIDAN